MTLELKTGEHRQRPTAGSAFAVLMSSPARGGFSVGQLPPKKGANIADGQLRGDWRLFNALVDVMERRGLGFTAGTAQTSGKKFLEVLTAVLFRFLVPVARIDRQSHTFILFLFIY